MQVRVIKLLTKLIKFWAEKIYKLGIRIAKQETPHGRGHDARNDRVVVNTLRPGQYGG